MTVIQGNVVRGASWTIGASLSTRLLMLVSSVAITHYVTPAEMGDIGAASIFVVTANSLTLLGTGPYLVATKERSREETFHITALNVVGVAVVILISLLLRAPLASFFKAPDSAKYLPWFLGCFVVDRVAFIPERLLIRQLEFRRIAVGRSAGDLGYVIFTLGFAWLGWGAFSVIIGNIARSFFKTVVLSSAVRGAEWLTPTPLKKESYRRILHFGLPVAAQGIIAGVAARWDNLVFSYLFGDAAMARYSVAYNLADLPADQIGEQIGEVLLPSFAKMSTAERDAAVVETTGLTALIIFPLSIGLAAVARTLVETILTPAWYAAGGMLTILAAVSITRPLSYQASAYLLAIGSPRIPALIDAVKLVLLFSLMVLLAQIGQLSACVAVGVAFGVALLILWSVVAKKSGRRIRDFVAECLPALFACAVMTAGVLGTRWAFARSGSHLRGLGLALEVIAGAISYIGALPIVARASTKKLVDLFKHAYRGRGRGD
jgi:lipopolysaccharide exporter